MRILNVTQSYFPFGEFGGPPVKVRALSQALARRGHQVTVLSVDWGLQPDSFKKSGAIAAVEKGAFGWTAREVNVEAIYLPTWLRYRAASWNSGTGRFCRKRLRDFDVVHIFGLYDFLGPAVAGACFRKGIPYVVEPIGMFVPIVRSFWLKRMYHLLLGRRMLSRCSFVVATSRLEATEIVSAGVPSEKIVLRRNGVERPQKPPKPGRFREARGIVKDAKVILFLGRLSQKKSPDLLLEAFALLCRRMDGAQLLFVGPDESGMQSKLARRAEQLGLAAQVRFCGAVFGEEKWSAYRDADVFVLPSLNENFGNTAAEAAAAGTPVVVTEKCGIAPLLAGVAGLVAAHDAASLCSAMERVLREPELREKLSEGGRELAARLDWDAPAEEMERLYTRAASAEERQALWMRA
jgi:glycosyltransferase involved in cell wall biosynthesis